MLDKVKIPTRTPTNNPTKVSSIVITNSPSLSPTFIPMIMCDYDNKKKCEKDKGCMWFDVNGTNSYQCVEFNCSLLSKKGMCKNERRKCSWNKKQDKCVTKS